MSVEAYLLIAEDCQEVIDDLLGKPHMREVFRAELVELRAGLKSDIAAVCAEAGIDPRLFGQVGPKQ